MRPPTRGTGDVSGSEVLVASTTTSTPVASVATRSTGRLSLAHVSTTHQVWRISLRAGANAWNTKAVVAVLVVLGSGAENILWGFQVGFLTALALRSEEH